MKRLGIRWTIGDVSDAGFEALRLSICGIWRIFGASAEYVVCVNSVSEELAKERVGAVPDKVKWVSPDDGIPEPLRDVLDGAMADGTAWKLLPPRYFPDAYELSLDNDCILWRLPETIRRWLDAEDACLLAADVVPAFGKFAARCGNQPRNTGIRGFPPGFDPLEAICAILREQPEQIETELDEQGLQVAAYSQMATCLTVPVEEVSICSPFPPHLPGLGKCGAHFVGLNARGFDWSYYGRPALDCRMEHWEMHKPKLARKVGVHPK